MDPNANLAEQLRLARYVQRGTATPREIDRLAELVEALDEWLRGGGVLPTAWERKP
jgi:hypothetical protein